MKSLKYFLSLMLVVCMVSEWARSQGTSLPVCDITCVGDSLSPDYDATYAARPRVPNGRGDGGPVVASGGPAVVPILLGSNSYNYNVPLISLPGRAGTNLNLVLYYNSRIWTVSAGARTVAFNADRDFPSYGFRLDFGFIEAASDGSSYVLSEADGSKHMLSADSSGKWVSTDSTFFRWDSINHVLTNRGGTRVFYQVAPVTSTILRPVKIEDTNGNFISISYVANKDLSISSVVDTLGRTVTFQYDTSGRLTSISQGSSVFGFTWTTLPLNYSFTLRVVNSPANGTAVNLLAGVNLPDGTSVRFDYGNGDWGIVKTIQRLSSSGEVRYSTSHNFPAVASGALANAPSFTQQTIFDGVNTAVWQYASIRDATSDIITSATVTDPAGTSMTTTFSDAGNALDGLPLTKTMQDASGNTLRVMTNTWTAGTLIPNPLVTKVTTQLETGEASQQEFAYDANGNVVDEKDYDFATSLPGPLLREIVRTMASLGNDIVDRPASVVIKDGNGNILGRTGFGYDGVPAQDVTPAGTAVIQHDSAYSVGSANSRGNVTQVTTYANAAASTGATTQTNTYDIAGNLVIEQTACCRKEWTFSALTQYAYPDSVVRGTGSDQLATSSTYDFDTGLVATTTDENGQVTRYGYDTSERIISVTQPDGTIVTKNYDDSSTLAGVTITTTANSLVQKATFGGAGQALTEQSLNGASVVGTKDMHYDNLGHLTSVSNVYGPNETPALTTYQYDPLGRTTEIMPPGNTSGYTSTYSGHMVTSADPSGQQRRSFADALGRLVRVDEPGPSGGAAGAGSVTVSGTEQSVATSSGNGATAGTASVTMGGTERSTQVVTHAATKASTTVTINGTEQSANITVGGGCTPGMICCVAPEETEQWRYLVTPEDAPPAIVVYDSGTVTVTIGGISKSVSYGQGDTGTTIASKLVTAFSGASASFSATASSNILTITATTAGSAGNSITVSGTSATNDVADFGGPSFSPTAASSTLTGGSDNVYATVYDTGTVTVSITANGTTYTKTVSYGQNSTPSTIAADLANQINADTVINKVVVAGASGTVLNLTTVAAGTNTAYGLTAGAVTNNTNFVSGSTSFSATPSGSTFTPGQNGTVWDAGTVTVTITGFSTTPYQRTANYSQGSTTTSIASSIAGAFNSDPASPVSATVSSNLVTLTAKIAGADTNYGVTTAVATTQTSFFSSASFSASAAALTGGQDPTHSLSAPLSTFYSYDALGNLLQVTQGQQTRTSSYNSMGKVTSVSLPETNYNATTFTYTPLGMVSTKTDARGVTTTYSYDAFNRLSSASYSDGTHPISFTYGAAGAAQFGAGRLIGASDGIGTQTFEYNNMGMVTKIARVAGSITYNTQYAYNAAGQIASITYPSGRVVTESYDPIGRLIQLGAGTSMIASIGSYTAAGQMQSVTYGNGMQGTFSFNIQNQIATIQYNNGGTSVLNFTYNYGPNDNGKILNITDNVNPTRSTAYTYDELGRLNTAQTTDLASSNTWKLKYIYDRYGNRLGQIPIAGTAAMPLSQLQIDPATNRIMGSGVAYDANGNVISDGLHSYAYDAENRIKNVDGGANSYSYDWGGVRVKKNGVLYIYSGPKVIAEYAAGASPSSPTVEYVYLKDQLAAKIAAGSTTYVYGDRLSPRSEADDAGAVVRTSGHFPFGETWYETGVGDKWKFTTYEHDAESGLEYAQARYDSPQLGRFMSMDSAAPDAANPQSLNRYPYGFNDPVNRTDPSGLYPQDQHEFITFLLASLAQQGGSFNWDPTELALGARDADNFYNAATGLLYLGAVLNFSKHFGIPGELDQDSYKAGFGLHLWEDNGNDAPHRISGNCDFIGARILNEILHTVLNLVGSSPDTSGNIAGFKDAWSGDGTHGKAMGQDPQKFPEQTISFIVGTVDQLGLTIVGMTIDTTWSFDDGTSVTINSGKLCEQTCDLSDAHLIGSQTVDGITVNIWQLNQTYDPLAGFDFNGWFFSELAMGSYSGGFAAGNPFGPNQKLLDCIAAGINSSFCQDVFGNHGGRHATLEQ